MADNVIGRTTIEIVGDTSRYNSSIDAAVQRTALMQARQRALTQELEQNQRKLDVSSRGLASNTSARERNAAAIQRAIAQYGQESTQVQRLLQTKASLERTTAQLTQRIEAFRSREQALNSQLTSVNQALAQQAANNGRITSSSNAASSSLSTMSQRLGSMMSMLKSMLAMRATRSFLEATIGGLSQFEQYETSFAVMLGNMQSAKDLMSDLQDFAAKTPYQLPDVTKAAQLLMNYGVEAKDLITTMTHLGDLSQGQADKLDRISLAYGQMLAKGKVTGEELRQMTEAGVPLTQALADNMGIATSELMGFIEKGQVGIPELDSAIEGLTTGTGKFAGMMEQQSQTLAGQWSTLKDNMGAFAREIGEEAFAETKSALAGISQEFAELKKSGELSALAKQWGAVFGGITKVVLGTTEALVKHKEMLGALVVAYGAWKVAQEINAAFMLKNKLVTEGATVAQAAFNATLSVNPLVLLAGALAVVVGGMLVFAQAADESTRKLRESQEQLQNLNDEVANIETSGIEDASSRLGELEMVSKQLVPEMQKIDETVEDVATRKKLLASRVEELNQVLGYEAASIDNITGHLKMNTDEIYKNVEALKAQAKAEATKAKMSDYYTQQIKAQEEIISDNEKIEELKVEREKLEQAKVDYLKKYGEIDPTADVFTNQIDAIDSQIKNFTEDIDTQNDIIDAAGDGINKLSGMLDEYSAAAGDAQEATEGVNSSLMDTDALMESLEGSEKRLKTLASAQKEAVDGGKLSISTIRALGESYSELMPYLNDYMAGIIDEKELIEQFPALYREESAQYSATMMQKYKDNEDFFRTLKNKNSELFRNLEQEYRGDRGNWSTLAQAKGDIEQNLITQLSKKWQEYYSAVGGNAAKTVEAMEQQLAQLNERGAGPKRNASHWTTWEVERERKKIQGMIDLMKPLTDLEGAFELNVEDVDFSATEKKKKESAKKEKTWQEKLYDELKYKREMEFISEQEYIDELVKIRDSYYGIDEDNFRKYAQEIYKLENKMKNDTKSALRSAFEDQIGLAKDYYAKQKELVEEQSEAEIKAINDSYDKRLNIIKEEYEAEKDRVDGIISELQREIDARKRARDEEKLNDDLAFAQTKIQNLQTQIQYARTPEERAELEKELKRQQEELKDLTVKKEVNELEAEKRVHQERLKNLEEEYKEDEKRLEKKRKKSLAVAEEARDQALKVLEDSFKSFEAGLYQVYGYVNQETLSIGKRFADATNSALGNGFQTVKTQAQATIDAMVAKVQDAVARLESSIERSKRSYRSGTAVAYSSSDNRSMLVTNNISRGLTEGQVARLMDRQAERLLYGRR
ncbi:tape measure protein [Anaeromassilibacillus senegalensis]|uniref:tape measure protein n=1 Tax=Anaeromassilibacillus senegalensis TaxID=1673717 RepID=UPI000681E82F|nr:tape measure protein [Anaeromassilibacillus senegalensis]